MTPAEAIISRVRRDLTLSTVLKGILIGVAVAVFLMRGAMGSAHLLVLAGLALFVGRSWTTFEEMRLMLAVMGTLGSFIGLGFIVSAGAAWALSQRFGLMDGTPRRVDSSLE